MPANGRWDLIRSLKVKKGTICVVSYASHSLLLLLLLLLLFVVVVVVVVVVQTFIRNGVSAIGQVLLNFKSKSRGL